MRTAPENQHAPQQNGHPLKHTTMQSIGQMTKPNTSLIKLEKDKLSTTQFKQIIRDIGLKVTHQRLIILEKLLKGRDHVTAQEVFESVIDDAPDIGFATVYRFLRALNQFGFVTEVRMKGLAARYEWAGKKHHDHLTCTGCGTIREFASAEIENLQLKISHQLGYVLTDHILELYGVCESCRKKTAAKVSPSGDPLLPHKT